MPILSYWYDSTLEKSRRKRDSNLGSSALEADALPLGQRGGSGNRGSVTCDNEVIGVKGLGEGGGDTKRGRVTLCDSGVIGGHKLWERRWG